MSRAIACRMDWARSALPGSSAVLAGAAFPAGAAAAVGGWAAGCRAAGVPALAARRTSASRTAPPGPVPGTVPRSTPSSAARRRASGVTRRRRDAAACSTSARVIVLPGPVPCTVARSTPSCAASCRTRGVLCAAGPGGAGFLAWRALPGARLPGARLLFGASAAAMGGQLPLSAQPSRPARLPPRAHLPPPRPAGQPLPHPLRAHWLRRARSAGLCPRLGDRREDGAHGHGLADRGDQPAMVPVSNDSTSMADLAVSTTAMMSPLWTSSPGLTSHSTQRSLVHVGAERRASGTRPRQPTALRAAATIAGTCGSAASSRCRG